MFDQYVSAARLRPGDVVEVDGVERTVVDAFQERSGSFVVKFEHSAIFGLPTRQYRVLRRSTIPA